MVAARLAMSAARALGGVVTPLYLALIGFSAFRIGEVMLAVTVAAAIMSSVIGLVADRAGAKIFIVGVPLLAAGAGVVFAFERNPLALVLAAAAGSFGRGAGAGAGMVGPYQPAEAALVTESLVPSRRNAAFGRLSFASSVGALFGGLAAITAGSGHPHGAAATAAFRPAFLLAAAFSLIASVIALALPAERPSPRGTGRRWRMPKASRGLLMKLWATNSVNGLAVGMFGPFITYWLFRRYGASAAQIGVLFAVINVLTAGTSLLGAPLARRWGIIRTLSVARALQALLLVPMVMAPTFWAAGAIYLVRMAIQRIGLPLRQSYVVAMAQPGERAAVAALSNLPSFAALALAPLGAGYLFDEVGLDLPFEIAALLQAANAAMYWLFFRHMRPAEELDQEREAAVEEQQA